MRRKTGEIPPTLVGDTPSPEACGADKEKTADADLKKELCSCEISARLAEYTAVMERLAVTPKTFVDKAREGAKKTEPPKYHLGAKIGKAKTRINNNFTKEPVKNKNTVKEKNSAEQQVKKQRQPDTKKE